jgi:hypothetical protein
VPQFRSSVGSGRPSEDPAAGLGVVDDDAEGELREKLLVKQEGAREAMLGLWGEFMSANGTKFANGSAHAG